MTNIFTLIGIYTTIIIAFFMAIYSVYRIKELIKCTGKKFLCKHKYEYSCKFYKTVAVKCKKCGKILTFDVDWEKFEKKVGVEHE